MSGYGSGGGYGDDERVSNVLSQETIDRAIAADADRRQQQQHASAGSHSSGSHSHGNHSHNQSSHSSHSSGPVVPGIVRRDTTTRRDPLTGDMIEDYSGSDPNGPQMRAHYDWDANQQTHSNTSNQPRSNEPRPGEVKRTNTTISYSSSGDRVEEHDGEGSLEVRAMYNEDDNTSSTYRPHAPGRGQSDNSRHY
ncbi:hypothetical protein Q9L58_004166 [Maublancomyces gigas]|uniref:Uncharacterized protein n=1 Tax=Discina gigas TaxID=1032678 RepID=A0ABR3GLL8_9PEZI